MPGLSEHQPNQSPATPKRGAYRPVSAWSAGTAIAATLVIIAASIGAGALLAVYGPMPAERASGNAAIALMGLSQLLMVALTLMVAKRGGTPWIDAFALHPPAGGLGDYVRCFALMIAALIGVNIVAVTLVGHDPYADLKQFAGIFKGDRWWLALIVVGIGAPLSEELLFRGFLQAALTRSQMGFWSGAIVSTVIWSALHAGYTVVGLIEVALIGAVFSYALWRTGSLRVTLACHALYNSALALFVRYLMPV